MEKYTREQLLHLDLPKEFRGNFQEKDRLPEVPWDLVLLAITVFSLFQENN